MSNTIPGKIVRRVIADILIERSNAIEDACNIMIEKEMEEIGVITEYTGEVGWTACGTRVLADDVLDGIMTIEEAVDTLTPDERKEAKARCQEWLDRNAQNAMNKDRQKLEQILKCESISENEEKIIFESIPELLDEKDFLQNNPWHIYDIWNHTKKVFENSKVDKEIRIVLLLHDIGKPHSYQDDEKGIRHFKGHSQKSAEISEEILKRLGYSENEISDICFLIANHDKTILFEDVNAENLETYKKLLYIQYCDASGYNPEYIQRVYDRLDRISSYLKGFEESNVDKKLEGEEK